MSDVALVEWLCSEVASPTVRSPELHQTIYAAFLSLRPVMAEPFLDAARLEQLPAELLSDILAATPTLILKLRPEFASQLIRHEYFSAFDELSSAARGRGDGRNQELGRYLLALDLTAEQRIELLSEDLDYLDEDISSSPEGGATKFSLERAQQQKDFNAALTVYAILSKAPQLEPEIVADIITALPEPQML